MPPHRREQHVPPEQPNPYERHAIKTTALPYVGPDQPQTNVNVEPAGLQGGGGSSWNAEDTAIAAIKLINVLFLLFGVIEGVIFIRFLLKAIAANSAAGFARLIYGLSDPLVAPFNGLLGTPGFRGAVFDFSALIAILIYVLISLAITKLLRIIFVDQPTLRR